MINFRLERLEYYDSLGASFGDAGFEVIAAAASAVPVLSKLTHLTVVLTLAMHGSEQFVFGLRRRTDTSVTS